jgi:hypothetical protein
MRALKFSVLLFFFVSFTLGLTAKAGIPCAPQAREYGPLHIEWIVCQNDQAEMVIIANLNDASIDLTGYEITSQVAGQRFIFKPGTLNTQCCTIQAHDILRIHSGPGNSRIFENPRDLHWLTQYDQLSLAPLWSYLADRAGFRDPSGRLVDSYQY